ncbi:MAG: hypothetical protein H6696_20155, partial [Deferribacteres bacterium]|nr:hypothetical protein [Deferribacteres bacterium]
MCSAKNSPKNWSTLWTTNGKRILKQKIMGTHLMAYDPTKQTHILTDKPGPMFEGKPNRQFVGIELAQLKGHT